MPSFGFRPRTEDAPVRLGDGYVIDAGFPAFHVAVRIELPQFVSVTAEPLVGRVVALVLESYRDPVAAERPQVLAQGVVEFAGPFPAQEFDDLGPAGDEFTPVTPDRVLAVRTRDPLRIAGIPRVLGRLDLLPGSLFGKGRQRRARGHGDHSPVLGRERQYRGSSPSRRSGHRKPGRKAGCYA